MTLNAAHSWEISRHKKSVRGNGLCWHVHIAVEKPKYLRLKWKHHTGIQNTKSCARPALQARGGIGSNTMHLMSGTLAQPRLLDGVWIVIILALEKMVLILSVSCTGMQLKMILGVTTLTRRRDDSWKTVKRPPG